MDLIKLQNLLRCYSIPEPNSGCWLWLGGVTNSDREYGALYIEGLTLKASRLSLHAFKGFDLKSKLYALHKCNVELCINPDHLYPGTQKQNIADQLKAGTFAGGYSLNKKKTHCKNGHEYSKRNTYINTKGARECRTCTNKAKYRYVAKKRKSRQTKC